MKQKLSKGLGIISIILSVIALAVVIITYTVVGNETFVWMNKYIMSICTIPIIIGISLALNLKEKQRIVISSFIGVAYLTAFVLLGLISKDFYYQNHGAGGACFLDGFRVDLFILNCLLILAVLAVLFITFVLVLDILPKFKKLCSALWFAPSAVILISAIISFILFVNSGYNYDKEYFLAAIAFLLNAIVFFVYALAIKKNYSNAKADEEKIEADSDLTEADIESENVQLSEKLSLSDIVKKIVITNGAFVAACVVALLIFSGSPVERIEVSDDVITLSVGQFLLTPDFKVYPESAESGKYYVHYEPDKGFEEYFSYKNGLWIAEKETPTVCWIKLTVGGKRETVEVKIVNKLKKIYDEFCAEGFAEIGADGSYLKIDTKPMDSDSDDEYDSDALVDSLATPKALEAIQNVNNELSLSDSVYQKMLETRAMDGIQEHTENGIKVSWSYHPDRGLEVMYETEK